MKNMESHFAQIGLMPATLVKRGDVYQSLEEEVKRATLYEARIATGTTSEALRGLLYVICISSVLFAVTLHFLVSILVAIFSWTHFRYWYHVYKRCQQIAECDKDKSEVEVDAL
jgi:hypothetical protein